MVDERESFEALEMENRKPSEEEEEEDEAEEEEDEQGEESERGCGGESRSSESEVGAGLRASESETLAVPSSSDFLEKDRCVGVKVNSTSKSNDGVQSEVGVPPEEVLAFTVVNDSARMENQHQSTACRNLSELSPTSVTQPISSVPSPTTIDHKFVPPKFNDLCTPKTDQKKSSALKTTSPVSSVKVPSSDGYNWRKYGQKQVKSPTGSRSYYKCTYSECYAKKIECSDYTGCVTEIVYKSQHTHDPPKKSSSAKEKLSSAERASGNNVAKQPCRVPKDIEPLASVKQSTHETPLCPDRKRQSLANSDENGNTLVKDEDDNEPEPKQRLKKSHSEYSDSLLKPSKKPKFVVHAVGDVGISADGFRWRKYGQKMVKGNPHPRNYYRCTSAGCPVRKHIETAVDDTNAVVITYKGVHDHDMPVPKKRHGPPSAPLVAAAAPASMNNVQQVKKSETVQNQTKWSIDKEGELTGEAMDLGGEKAMESARTLLSIGFEIKPC